MRGRRCEGGLVKCRRRALSASACRSGCRDDCSLPSARRARTPSMGVAVLAACCAWRAAAVPRQGDGGGTRISSPPRVQASPVSIERRPRRARRRSWNSHRRGAWLGSRRAVGDASTRRAAMRDTGIEPHERRQRDLEYGLVIPGEGGHRPGWLRSTCGCPTTRTYQSVRAQTWPFGWYAQHG